MLSPLTKINPGRQVRGKRGNNKNKVLESKSNFKSPSANRQTFTEGEMFLKGLRFHDTTLCCFCYQRKQWQPSGGKLELPKGCDRRGWKGWVRGSLNSFLAPLAFEMGEHAEVRREKGCRIQRGLEKQPWGGEERKPHHQRSYMLLSRSCDPQQDTLWVFFYL